MKRILIESKCKDPQYHNPNMNHLFVLSAYYYGFQITLFSGRINELMEFLKLNFYSDFCGDEGNLIIQKNLN